MMYAVINNRNATAIVLGWLCRIGDIVLTSFLSQFIIMIPVLKP